MKARCVLLGILISITAWGQSPKPATPATAPSEMDRILPELRFDNVSLEGVTNSLSEVSGANIVIVRDKEVAKDYPALGAIRLKNVTVHQFLQFIAQAYEGTEVVETDGPGSTVYVIRIKWTGRNGADPAVQSANPPGRNSPIVRVYNLADVISALTEHKAGLTTDQKNEAINQLLSLIKAALDQQGEKEAPVLSVHQPTQTLIFKGSNVQLQIIDQVLGALRPRANNTSSSSETDYKAMQQSLRDASSYQPGDRQDVDRRPMAADDIRKLLVEEQSQVAQLQAKLAALEKANAKPKD